MNFKTPFKVLTTAALIGTLSLSAVAPGASAATNQAKTSVTQKAATTIENVVFKTADGQYLTLTPSDYLDAKEAGVDFSKLELVAVQADNKTYSKSDYLDAKEASQNDPAKAFELLAKTEGAALEITTTPASIEKDENGDFVVKPGTPTEEADFEVTEIAAINSTSVKVNFSKAAESLDKADVTVTNAKSGDKQYIKSVTLSEDKKSATVEFYDALTTKNSYKVAVKDAGEATLDFVVAEVKEIQAETTQTLAPVGGNVDLTKLSYKVLDENGLDITDTTTVGYESTETVNSNKIALADGKSAFVYITATKEDGTKVKSERITVKSEAAKLKEITDVTVGTAAQTGAQAVFTAADYKQNLTVQKGAEDQKLIFAGKDQYGSTTYAGTAKFESLDKEVGLVDASTGVITAFKEGTLPVKVTVGSVTKTVEVKVVADAKATSLKADKAELTLSNKQADAETVKVELLDQYEATFKPSSAQEGTAKVISGSDLITLKNGLDAALTDDKVTFAPTTGATTLKVTPVANKSGSAVIEVKVGDIKTTIKVTVTAAGAVDDYKVNGFVAELDKNSEAKDEVKSMTLSTIPVDANGVVAGEAVKNATYVVKNSKNEVQDSVVKSGVISAKDLEADETYTLYTTVGTIELPTQTFKVVDTSAKPSVAAIAGKATIDENNANVDLAKIFEITLKGEKVAAPTFKNIKYTSADQDVVKSATKVGVGSIVAAGKAGTADLVLHSATVTIGGKDYDVSLNNAPVTVTVTDKAKAVVAAKELADAKTLIDTKSVEVAYGKKADTTLVLEAIKALDKAETKNTVISGLKSTNISIKTESDTTTATVTLAEGTTAIVTVKEAASEASKFATDSFDLAVAKAEAEIAKADIEAAITGLPVTATTNAEAKNAGVAGSTTSVTVKITFADGSTKDVTVNLKVAAE